MSDDAETVDESTIKRAALEESARETVKLIFLLAGMAGVVIVQKLLEDPDIGFKVRWYWKRFGHLVELRIHELEIGVETAVGLYKIQEHLRQQWRVSKP